MNVEWFLTWRKKRSSVELFPGLYLLAVRPERTLWVAIPDEAEDRALPLGDACEQLMKPALAAIRQREAEVSHGETSGRTPPSAE